MSSVTSPDLCDPAVFADGAPHDLFRQLREESAVSFSAEPDGPGFWSVFGYEEVLEVSRHPERFGSAPAVFIRDPDDGETASSELLINLDAPRHTQLRKLVNRGFTPRQINILEPRIRDLVRELLDAAAAR